MLSYNLLFKNNYLKSSLRYLSSKVYSNAKDAVADIKSGSTL